MRLEDIQKRVGEVVILDLINGAQVTTEVKEVQPDDEGVDKHWVVVGKLILFQVSLETRDPRLPPNPETNPVEHKVRNGSYGFPLIDIEDEKTLDLDHILMAHECHPDMAKVYTKVVTGIEIAPAGALNAIDAANKGRIALK